MRYPVSDFKCLGDNFPTAQANKKLPKLVENNHQVNRFVNNFDVTHLVNVTRFLLFLVALYCIDLLDIQAMNINIFRLMYFFMLYRIIINLNDNVCICLFFLAIDRSLPHGNSLSECLKPISVSFKEIGHPIFSVGCYFSMTVMNKN